MPNAVQIVEVGPRDGFQMESKFIPTALKVEIIDMLAGAGVHKIETTSFVSPKVVPQMADAEDVMAQISRATGVAYTALVPNVMGAKRAIAARASAIRIVICASETYNRRNVGLTVRQSIENCRELMLLAQSAKVGCEAIIALAFGCPLQGEVEEESVIRLADELVDLGYTAIGIADSIGVANPLQVRHTMTRLRLSYPDVSFSVHFHNTRGLGLANVLGALEAGVTRFDSSFGGLGGCPVVPGGTGNISTEDLVNLMEEMNIATGIDVAGIVAATRKMEEFLERKLPSYVASAGTRRELFARAVQARAAD